MKKKKLKIILLVVAIAVVVIVAAGFLLAETAVQAGIERAGSDALGVAVAVGGVDMGIFSGRVTLENMALDNPEGYSYPRLLNMDNAFVEASIGSLLGDTVHVRQIKLDGIELFIEQKGMTNNLQQIMKSMPASQEPDQQKQGKKLQIDLVELTNTTVNVKLLPVGGTADTVKLSLDMIRLEDLGGDKKINTGELMAKVMVALTAGIAKQGASVLPGELVSGMKGALEDTMNIGRDVLGAGEGLLKEGAGAGEGVLKEGAEAGKKTLEGIKGIFDRKEDQ